jgi:bifunctional non-homologous end joining protein LigD
MSRNIIEIAGQRLPLSNLEKELYPAYGFTKAHVLEYYRRMAPLILPHLHDRPVTLTRYPDGVDKDSFFEKRCPSHHPSWTQTAELRRDDGELMTVCLVNNLETLLWLANLAALELHVPLYRATTPETPDAVVFDLDPGLGADILDCARVALILRELLSRLRLTCSVKSSGKKGLHVYLPLNHKGTTFADTKGFAKAVAIVLQNNYPALVTSKMAKEERRGKVFINWSQNDPSKTMICVYSLRGQAKPFVSFPLAWQEVERLVRENDPQGGLVLAEEALRRGEEQGDLFHELLTIEQKLPHL